MISDDPRRKRIAEAMAVRHDRSRFPAEAAYDALPVAVELIEELTAELSRESYTLRRAVERATQAEATIAEQAKEIEDAHNRDAEYQATIAGQAKEIEGLVTAEQEEGPREMNLERVLKASERASEQVAGWPEWKRKLGSAEQEEGT